jgi:hypothetical protein
MVNILLRRFQRTSVSTIGRLFIDDRLICYTLEDPIKEGRHVAIPAGTYPLTICMSPQRGYDVLVLEDVPGRPYVDIHPGETPRDADGCIVVGTNHGTDLVKYPRPAFALLFSKVKALLDLKNQVWIIVE